MYQQMGEKHKQMVLAAVSLRGTPTAAVVVIRRDLRPTTRTDGRTFPAAILATKLKRKSLGFTIFCPGCVKLLLPWTSEHSHILSPQC